MVNGDLSFIGCEVGDCSSGALALCISLDVDVAVSALWRDLCASHDPCFLALCLLAPLISVRFGRVHLVYFSLMFLPDLCLF